jgi:hypothetical protein
LELERPPPVITATTTEKTTIAMNIAIALPQPIGFLSSNRGAPQFGHEDALWLTGWEQSGQSFKLISTPTYHQLIDQFLTN